MDPAIVVPAPARIAGASPAALRAAIKAHGRLHTYWRFEHVRDGEVLWASDWQANALTNEGEINILDVYFADRNAPPGDFYMGLGTDGATGTSYPPTLADTDTLATITELSGVGYARIVVARAYTTGFTLAGSTMTTTLKTFTAGGTWAAARFAFLCDAATGTAGKLLAHTPLSTERLLLINDQLNCSIAVALD